MWEELDDKVLQEAAKALKTRDVKEVWRKSRGISRHGVTIGGKSWNEAEINERVIVCQGRDGKTWIS